MYLITVLVEYEKLQQQFTYHHTQKLEKYIRVVIPFRNKEIIGFVLDVKPYEELAFKTKSIIKVIDEQPILNEELIQLAYWMEKQYFTTLIRCLYQILPKKLQPKTATKPPRQIAYLQVLIPVAKKTIPSTNFRFCCKKSRYFKK